MARDLLDATGNVSADWRFGIAYNAALKCCTALLNASGYRPDVAQAHYRTIIALPVILGDSWKMDEKYLNRCREKRNTVEYDMVGVATDNDVKELLDFARRLQKSVIEWMQQNHPQFLKNKKTSKRKK